MNYLCYVPIELEKPLSTGDPDVRGIRKLPGFIRLGQLAGGGPWYELAFEVEAGSTTDARDAAEELVLSYADALSSYRPRLWAPVGIEVRTGDLDFARS